MPLSQLNRPRNLPLGLLAAGFLAVLYAAPVSAEPHGLDPDTLAGPQDDFSGSESSGLTGQPEPVYPNGDPEIDTLESDDTADAIAEPAKPKIVATIDKSTQSMSVFVDGVEKHNWPVSTGIGGYSTPSGSFTASSMNKIWYSRQWDNAPMPHSVFFTKKGHAIHATNEVKKLGKPASHGCVRLAPKNAETFFNLVKEAGLKNTEVVLTGVTPGGEYKITQPPPRDRYRERYGYYEEAPPPVYRKRRRLFQPYYDAPRQYRQQPRQRTQQRRRWFFRN